MGKQEQIRVEESAGVIRIETRPWSLLGRVMWTFIAAIFLGISWPSFIASFVTGSGDAGFRIIFGVAAITSTLWLVVIWTNRSRITVTRERIRWRIGSALFWRNRDVAIRDVERPELEVKRTRSQDGSSSITFLVHLRCRNGGRQKLAIFRGAARAASHQLIEQISELLRQR